MGFGIVGFGCTTCIGNSGDLTPASAEALADGRLQAAVLSGNRNFPGRVHPQLEAGFLASPPLVVAFALAGDVERDILRDDIAPGVRLADLWPTGAEIDAALAAQGLDPRAINVLLELPSNEACLAAVGSGKAATAVSARAAAAHTARGLLATAGYSFAPRWFAMLRHNDRAPGAAARAFIAMVREHAGDRPSG